MIIFSLWLVYLYSYTRPISASRGFCIKLLTRISSNFYTTLTYSSTVYALPFEISMKHLESSKSTQIKSQNDRPSPEIQHDSRPNLRVPSRFDDIKGALFVLKIANLTTVWHEIFACSNFCDFCDFSSEPQKKRFQHVKITASIFPQKFTPD